MNWELIGFDEGCVWLKTTLVLGTGYAIAKPAPARTNVVICQLRESQQTYQLKYPTGNPQFILKKRFYIYNYVAYWVYTKKQTN